MSININTNLKLKKVITILSSVILGLGMISSYAVYTGGTSNVNINKSAQAASSFTSNLIIGTKDVGTAVELTVCLQSTSSTPIHLANVSNWFSYSSAALTPSLTILEVGRFGVTGNTTGYGRLKWLEVPGSTNPTYGLTLSHSADSGSGTGELISSTPELFGKVKFDKVTGSTASTTIAMTSNVFYSLEDVNAPMTQTVTNVVGDCRSSTTVASSSSSSSSSAAAVNYIIGNPSATVGNPIVGTVGSPAPYITLSGNTYPNGTVATFTPQGSATMIQGTIVNGNFVPNAGQIIPTNSTIGNATGILKIGSASVNIPTNFSAAAVSYGTGGVITINMQNNTTPAVQTPTTAQATTPAASPAATSSTGTFKSKIKITDPYVCGQGAYGNVMDPKQNGVDYVYYEFYKDSSTSSAYSFKLKMNENGDFFLPISKSTNVIADGNYKIVFYAYDKEGNKAQGEYTAQIASDCTNAKINGVSSPTVRTGGLEIVQFTVLFLAIMASYKFYRLSKNSELKWKA